MRSLLMVFALAATAGHGQWEIQTSGTAAGLRGIDSVGGGVAWASGTGGTVLRTVDGGQHWEHCAVPPDAEKLDFRGVQAFDAKTAIVMSSGKGDLSRLYKTVDGCASWKLVFTNPDKDGFWDAVQAREGVYDDQPICTSSTKVIRGAILGDPAVHKSNVYDKVQIPSIYLARFTVNASCLPDKLEPSAAALFSGPNEASFAASNSILHQPGPDIFWIATDRQIIQYEVGFTSPHSYAWESVSGLSSPLRRGSPSQGIFSFAVRPGSIEDPKAFKVSHPPNFLKGAIVAVGGDYLSPDEQTQTAAFTAGGKKLQLAKTQPHGYRSAVAYDPATKAWITVGPNGTDVSFDDGKNWKPLTPTKDDAPDADKNWNALSLPFVVGPKGRIGVLRAGALTAAK